MIDCLYSKELSVEQKSIGKMRQIGVFILCHCLVIFMVLYWRWPGGSSVKKEEQQLTHFLGDEEFVWTKQKIKNAKYAEGKRIHSGFH